MFKAFLFISAVVLAAASVCSAGEMVRVEVRNAQQRLAIANDGTPQIFYFSPSTDPKGSNLWLIEMQGGYFCLGEVSCKQRWEVAPHLMSSDHRPNSTPAVKYNSQDPSYSPFASANQVFVAYTSSDAWVGNTSNSRWQFRGLPSILAVFEDLMEGFVDPSTGRTWRIGSGSRVITTGTSAGAIGLLMTGRRIGNLVMKHCPSCNFQMIPDSGIFMGQPADPLENRSDASCEGFMEDCSIPKQAEIGFKFWGAIPDPTCAAAMQAAGKPSYHCAFGENIYKFLGGYRFFLVAYMFDLIGILADSPKMLEFWNTTDWTYFKKLTAARKAVFASQSSFVPSCFGHVIASYLNKQTAGNVLLNEALRLWYFEKVDKSFMDDCDMPFCRKECYPKLKLKKLSHKSIRDLAY